MNIIDKIDNTHVPKWGNKKQYIAVHYLGVDGQNDKITKEGYGAHFYVFWDGSVRQACSLDAIVWQVGTGGYYVQKHPHARNSNTIGIEMCCHCDGDASKAGEDWWFTEETQKSTVELVKHLMQQLNIPPENVLRHYDIVNKTCPAPYVHNVRHRETWTWAEFKKRLASESTEKEMVYRIRKSWEDASSQIGAYTVLSNAKNACLEGYSVFDPAGNIVYGKSTSNNYPYVARCTGNGVRVRVGAGMGYADMKEYPRLNKNNLVDVIGKQGAWYHVRIAGKHEGYVSEKYLERV